MVSRRLSGRVEVEHGDDLKDLELIIGLTTIDLRFLSGAATLSVA